MSNTNKKKRGRKKKFDGESKVISFRIDKNVYAKKKDKIRQRVNKILEEHSYPLNFVIQINQYME